MHQGLQDDEITRSREEHGSNTLEYDSRHPFWELLKDLFAEPMVILLLAASGIYLILGEIGDALFLAAAILLVAAISLYQDKRSQNALEKLKKLSAPHCKVIRNGELIEIPSGDVVVGDVIQVEEGGSIPADARILQSNDFSVNESMLTGESLSIFKDANSEKNMIFRGTAVVTGLALAEVTAVGTSTEIGKIGSQLESIGQESTPLEKQIHSAVRKMIYLGVAVFLITWALNYFRSSDILDSLLKALTMAMSILPEEIPVAFTTFMALGAWRLMKMGIVVKQMKTVETLGSATVICTDKTGTITENRMELTAVFTLEDPNPVAFTSDLQSSHQQLLRMAMWSSEPIPFDPMEVALHEAYGTSFELDERPNFSMVHEYPLGGKPPMMTHIFEDANGTKVIAAKGAPEALMVVSSLTAEQRKQTEDALTALASKGYRVLGVGCASFEGDDYPKAQQEFNFEFNGLVAFYDPPKPNVESVFNAFYKAGIDVKIVTGDNAATTASIARQVNFKGVDESISGDQLMQLTTDQLDQKVEQANIFTRMFPEAKLKIILALKGQGQIVAMIGDGVNDGPALKAAHIGVAMGHKGTEIAKEAASLILLEDDFSKLVDAVAMGRRIYTNLKKAIQYVISVHIPIILTVFLPLALGWIYSNIFSPIHVIILELIMGPTCSIIYENEPMEKYTMEQPPRPISNSFFQWKELSTSILQGIMIAVGILIAYQWAVQNGANEPLTRTMVFTTLMTANIFLTLVNRSFYYSILTTLKYRNKLVPLIIGISVLLTACFIYVPPLTSFFDFEPLNAIQLAVAVILGMSSVLWYEGVKLWKRRNS